jgi:uncharacterized protein YcsI (UPF0317 family)
LKQINLATLQFEDFFSNNIILINNCRSRYYFNKIAKQYPVGCPVADRAPIGQSTTDSLRGRQKMTAQSPVANQLAD